MNVRMLIFLLATLGLGLISITSRASIQDQIDLKATAKDVCTPGWAASHRNVSAADERATYARQGLTKNSGACARKDGKTTCVVDHAISLENGGLNVLANLQVQFIEESKAKDRIENFLHGEVCSGRLPLEDAQWLEKNWKYLAPR